MRTGATKTMAEFAVSSLDAAPKAVWTMAKRMLLNAAGLAVGSADAPAVRAAYDAIAELRTPAEAIVLGRGVRVGVGWAALINGIAIHLEDFDDTYMGNLIHPSAPIVPAALAMAEYLRQPGRRLLEGVIVGVEIAMRVGNALGPAHVERHWHITGTIGHIGAAAAAARVAGLDCEQTQQALGIGASQAAGIRSSLGTMTKSLHPGKAAFDGIEAALLAQLGMSGAPDALEGTHGLAAVMSDGFDTDTLLDGIGEKWLILEDAFKPYACGLKSHVIIDAAMEMRPHFTSSLEIERIDVQVHPFALDAMRATDPRTGLEAKFSAYHCAAIGFLDGVAGPEQFSDARAVDPEVVALRRKVRIKTTPEMHIGAAVMTVTATDGRTVRVEVPHAVGSIERPMTQAQIEVKARLAAGADLSALIRIIDRLEEASSTSELIEAVPVRCSD